MNVYIKAVGNFPLLHEGWTCLEEFRNRGANVKLYEEFEEIPLNRNTLLVSDIDDTRRFFNEMGWKVDTTLTFPISKQSSKYWKRNIFKLDCSFENIKMLNTKKLIPFPCFVKPLNVKGFIYEILENEDDFLTFCLNNCDKQSIVVSEVVEFYSEWRIYVLDGKVLGMFNYLGNQRLIPNFKVIDTIIKEYKDSPISYALDVGILRDGETAIVEFNAFWSLGNYGIEPKLYVRGITNCWREILEKNPI